MHTSDLDDRNRWSRHLVHSKNMVKNVTKQEAKELNELTEDSVLGMPFEGSREIMIQPLIRFPLLARSPKPAPSTISLPESYTTNDPNAELHGTVTFFVFLN